MEKFFIEEAKCELTKGGIACGPVDPNRIPYVHVGNRALINSEKLLEFLSSGTLETNSQG